MKVLVTGAAGFLGRHFTRFHLDGGDDVVAIDDMSSPYAEFEPWIKIQDCRDTFSEYMASGFDRIYHFAAKVGGREKIELDPMFNADSLELDSLLFRWAAADAGLVTIVYPSSSAVYGIRHQGLDGEPLSESLFHPSQLRWDAPDEMYGFTKMVGEFLAWKSAPYGVNTLCIRPFSGYGEDQSPEYPFPSIIRRIKNEENPIVVWGHGEQVRDFIHVDDIVLATDQRLRDARRGYDNMNIGSGVGTSFLELAARACYIAGHDADIEPLPDKPIGVLNRVADPSEMREVWKPKVSLDEGIRRALSV